MPSLTEPSLTAHGGFSELDVEEVLGAVRPWAAATARQAGQTRPWTLTANLAVAHVIYKEASAARFTARVSREAGGRWQALTSAPRLHSHRSRRWSHRSPRSKRS